MIDEALEAKQLRVEDARRKLAWFDEEKRELQLLPILQEYFYLRSLYKTKPVVTREEEARLLEVEKVQEVGQFQRNRTNSIRALKELEGALEDLEAYRRSNNIPQDLGSVPIDQKPLLEVAAEGDDDSSKSVVPSSENGSQQKIQTNSSSQLVPELRRRRRGGNECENLSAEREI